MRSGDIRHHPDLLIPVEGATVAATRYEPPGDDGPHPGVLVATPYRKDDWITFGSWHPSIEYFARSGYEVVVADLVGTGASTGEPTPFARADGEHMATVVDWLSDREWTTGRVGMFGLSYGAWTQYATAAAAPEALEAIVPVSVSPSGYDSSYTGGVLNPLKRAVWATEFQARQALPPGRRDPEGRWSRVWHDRLDRLERERPWLFRFLDHELEDDFWAERAVAPEEVDVPTLAACGTRDVHTASMVPFVEALDVEKRLVVGPWRHRMPEQGRETAVDFRRQAVDWFDRHLREAAPDREGGGPSTRSDLPPVVYWTERDGGWTVGAGTWRGRDRWPTVGTHPTRSLVLTPDGLEPGGEGGDADEGIVTDPVVREREYDHTVGMESLERVGGVANPGVDTSADDARSITAETSPLEDAVEFTGTGVVVARVSATTPAPVVGARVVDVAPDDAARLVTSGRLAADHRTGHAPGEPEPLPDDPGDPVDLEIALTPTSHVFEPGHRVRLAVAAGHHPRVLPRREQGRLRIHSTPGERTALRFPGVVHDGEVPEFDDAMEMSPPDERVPVRTPYTSGESGEWETTRSHVGDRARFSITGGKTVTRPDGTALTWHRDVTASVVADAPGTATFETRIAAELDHGHESVRVEATGRVSRDVAHLETEVWVDGSTVFDERWRR